MSTPRCPICERPVATLPESRMPESSPGNHSPGNRSPSSSTHPFCSARCKLIDLGNWLDGAYRIPGPPTWLDEGDDGSGQPPS